VEPKDSLEIQTRNILPSKVHDEQIINDNDDNKDNVLNSWCLALHQVACRVSHVLKLPPNVLLQETDTQKSLDLMRVFYYHAVIAAVEEDNDTPCSSSSANKEALILGSSPHTDWGSWTVVWQDSVGGLQTYCHACQTWVDVTPAPAPSPVASSPSLLNIGTKNRWNCIVHVGDVTSLVLSALKNQIQQCTAEPQSQSHHAQQQLQQQQQQQQRVVSWPSPKHRVVSCNQKRTSLVYFAYPPPHLSLKDIERILQNEWTTTTMAFVDDYKCSSSSSASSSMPLEEYYLLKNQSISGITTASTTASSAAKAIYESIHARPLGDVLQEKWQQVQR
jgi:hypothetical protein